MNLNPIEAFAAQYCTDDLKCPVPDFHREMYEIAYAGHTRIAITAPRSFAKSTVFSKIYPLYHICVGDLKRIAIVSATGTLAEHWLREIKNMLEKDSLIIEDFGNMVTGKWTQDHIICQRPDGSTVEVLAKGQGYQLRGFRPDLIIIDDIETDEGSRSSEQREKLLDWFNSALINTLEVNSQLVMVGTMIHPLGLLTDVMGRKGYVTRKYQAVLPDNTSLWPEKWSREALQEREDEIGTRAFASEFQNEPIISENPIIIKEWIKYYDEESATFSNELGRGLRTVVAIDPAISRKQSADYTAICSISASFDAEPTFYVRRGGTVRGRWTINEQVHQLVRKYDKFTSSKMIVETVGYQEALSDEVKRYMSDNRRFIQIKEIKPDKDKERRVHAIVSMIERGQVKFAENDSFVDKLISEMLVFPTGDHDDLVDAFVYALTDLADWSKRKGKASQKPYIVLPAEKNQITGIS